MWWCALLNSNAFDVAWEEKAFNVNMWWYEMENMKKFPNVKLSNRGPYDRLSELLKSFLGKFYPLKPWVNHTRAH